MSDRADDVKAGIMVLVLVGLFLAFLVFVYGVQIIPTPQDRYYALYDFSGGIAEGTTVRFGGLQVGKVTKVAINDGEETLIRIQFEVDQGTPIKTDSVVQIRSLSMLGNNYIEVTTGSAKATLARAGASGSEDPVQLEGVPQADMGALFAKAGDLMDGLNQTVTTINEGILKGDRALLKERMGALFDQISALLADVNDVVSDENRANIAATLATLRGTLDDNRPDIRTTIANMRDMSERLKLAMVDVQGMVGDVRPEVQEILDELDALMENLNGIVTDTRPTLHNVMENLNATAASASDLTENLAEEPWRLIWRSEETAENGT